MVDLFKDWVILNLFFFINVGVDCFGLIIICCGRSIVKCYGVLFICFLCCVIYIEVVYSFDIDFFVNVMRRFILRRGWFKEICFDNGSNFVGGEKELREVINYWSY